MLVATNVEAAKLAAALHARGLRASYARAGLLETPEGTLVDASLRWLVDRRDSLSAAKLDALFDFDADTWLTQQLARTPEEAPWQGMLEPLRTRLSVFSPREAVDEVLRAVDVVRLCERWPNPAQRVANLDALRALVMDYEDRHCPNERESATVAGLLRFFDTVGTPTLRRDEMVASDDQHVALDEGSVVVTTYHRSKGLEWPVVVLGSLNKKEKRDVFEVLPESDGRAFDPERPLEGRWIRYWPGREVKAAFVDAIERSPEAQRVADREERERARLLYVGFTRARDHLVLAVGVTVKEATRRSPENVTAKCVWLDTLADESGAPLLRLPVDARDGATGAVALATGGAWPARVWRVNDQAPAHAEARPEVRQLLDRGSSTAEARTYRIRPSNAADDWPDLPPPVLGEVVTLPGSLPVEGKVADDGALGDAVHAFFAADVVADRDARLARARRTLGGLVGQIRPEAMLDASDRLRAFVGARWPAARWHREIPVAARTDDGRAVGGTMDLLLETEQGWVLLDHKTFPARSEAAWRAKLDEFRPQMAAYARSLALTGRAVKEAWIHLPVGGGLVQLVWR